MSCHDGTISPALSVQRTPARLELEHLRSDVNPISELTAPLPTHAAMFPQGRLLAAPAPYPCRNVRGRLARKELQLRTGVPNWIGPWIIRSQGWSSGTFFPHGRAKNSMMTSSCCCVALSMVLICECISYILDQACLSSCLLRASLIGFPCRAVAVMGRWTVSLFPPLPRPVGAGAAYALVWLRSARASC